MPRLLKRTLFVNQQTPAPVPLSATGMKISTFQTSGGRRPVYALRAAPRQAAERPDLSEKKLQIEIEIGIEEKWPAEMRESISIPIAISIPTNPRPLEPSIMWFHTRCRIA